MLYDAKSSTLLQTVMDGSEVTDAKLEEYAALKGTDCAEGKPVGQVALVFLAGELAQPHLANVKRFGLECRAIVDGQEQVLFAGSRVVQGPAAQEGPLYPLLREESWPHVGAVVHRALIDGPVKAGPWVTFAKDLGKQVARIEPRHLAGRSQAELEEEAIGNLSERTFEVQQMSPGVLAVFDEYGAEGLLVPELMKSLQERAKSPLLVVGVPKEGGFIATSASNPRELTAMMAWTRKTFDEATGRRISPLPLLAQDGKVIGFAAPDSERQPAPTEKSRWRFW